MNAENVSDEIKFIDEQMIVAEEKNRHLRDEVEQLKIEVMKVDPNFKFWDEDTSLNIILPIQNERINLSMTIHDKLQNSSFISKQEYNDRLNPQMQVKKKAGPNLRLVQSVPKLEFSIRENTNNLLSTVEDVNIKDILKLRKELETQKNIYEKIKELYHNETFYAGRFETVFLDCIRRVSERTKEAHQRQSNGKLPLILPSRTVKVDNFGNADEQNKPKKLENIIELSLSEIDKKNIMEEFLQNGLVKEFLYQKLVATSKQYQESSDQ